MRRTYTSGNRADGCFLGMQLEHNTGGDLQALNCKVFHDTKDTFHNAVT